MTEGAPQLAGQIVLIADLPSTTTPDPTSVIAWHTYAGWQQLVSALWAVCVIVAVVVLLQSITGLRQVPGPRDQHDQARARVVHAGSVLMCLVGAGIILTTIFTIAS